MSERPSSTPIWATDSGTKLEPSAGEKAAGFSIGTRAPARWVNWLLNLICQWVSYHDVRDLLIAVSNWFEQVNPKNFWLNSVAYDGSGLWVAVGDADGTDAYIVRSLCVPEE